MSGISVPNTLLNGCANDADDVAGVPSVLIEEPGECRCAFIHRSFRAGIAGGVEEPCDQCLVTAALIVGCEEGLSDVE